MLRNVMLMYVLIVRVSRTNCLAGRPVACLFERCCECLSVGVTCSAACCSPELSVCALACVCVGLTAFLIACVFD